MGSIIGYGKEMATPILVKELKRIECRGYECRSCATKSVTMK